MSAIQFTNQFPGELSASLTAIATTLVLKSGHGDEFPVIANGQDKYFFVTVVDKNGAREIVKIIQRASGSDTLVAGSSIADQPSGNVSGRAQEGTTAIAVTYTDDHLVELRLTAGTMQFITDHVVASGAAVHGLGSMSTQNANAVAITGGSAELPTLTRNSIDQGKDVTAALHRKIVEIGDWDMDTNGAKNVAHGLTASKIRQITGVLRNDDDAQFHPITPYAGTSLVYIALRFWDSTWVYLDRAAGSAYDAPEWNSTSFNRGWLLIDYVD